MYHWSRSLILTVALLPHLVAQNDAKRPHSVSFKTDASLVLVPATVLDRRNGTVNGLRAEAFNVFQDKVSQHIFSFAEQDVPASIGVILDTSGSMKATLNQARVALRSFLDTANPEDEAFLYYVSSRPDRSVDFTGDLDALLSGARLVGARGSTALIDTIYCSLNEMRSANRARRALLVISDGMDNHSRYSKTELMDRALESDVQIYTISIYDPPAYEKPIQLQEERRGLLLLEDLAERTGGLNFVIRNPEDIDHAAATISRAIRNEYTIGYLPRNTNRNGEWHSIHVKLSVPGLRVYARSGYYAR